MEAYPSIFIPGPTDAPGNTGDGAGSLAGAGVGAALTPILGPLAAPIGGFLGGLFGGGRPGGSNGGLQDALQSGIGSLFGSSSSSRSVQEVNTTQYTGVNVENVLGGRKFGNYNEETGDFETFQAISDVFAIKAAQDQARLASSASVPAGTQSQTNTAKPLNFTPLIVAGGLALALILLRRK